MYNLEAGLKYSGRDIKGLFKLSQPTVSTRNYNGDVLVQWNTHRNASTQFSIAQGYANLTDFFFTSTTRLPNMDPIKLKGNLKLFDQKSSANIEWVVGEQNYTAVVEYIPNNNLTSEEKIKGEIQINSVKYEGNMILKNSDREKALIVDLKSNKHVYLVIKASDSFDDVKFDFMWDKDNDPFARILIESEFNHQSLSAHLIIMEYEAKVNGIYSTSSFNATIEWGSQIAVIELKFLFELIDIEFLFALQTSNPVFSNIRTHLKFLLNSKRNAARNFILKVFISLSNCY